MRWTAVLLSAWLFACADPAVEPGGHELASRALTSDVRCFGEVPTVYVEEGRIVGGPLDGEAYEGLLRVDGPSEVVLGTLGADRLRGTEIGGGGHKICLLDGDDRVVDVCNDCRLDMGPGNDTAGWGHRTVYHLGPGNDVVQMRGEDARVFGGPGDDEMEIYAGSVVFHGGTGNDRSRATDFAEIVSYLGPGDDRHFSEHFIDARVYGGAGEDSITIGAGVAYGGEDNDTLTLRSGGGTLIGGPGDDILQGWRSNDHLDGGPGYDILRGENNWPIRPDEEDFCIGGEEVTECEVVVEVP